MLGSSMTSRRYPIGAELTDAGVSFRVWAPDRRRVDVVIEGRADSALVKDAGGYFEGTVRGVRAGDRYRFRLDGEGACFPDPASRFQPDGPHGPSEVVDPAAYSWSDERWRGVAAKDRIVYEMHVGTFTEAGTFAAARAELHRLAELGITLVELMPIADFPGTFGWGYDGVDLWAPTRLYGTPDDFRRFVDAAHAAGIGVILDVVYNHLGPDGNYLAQYSKRYLHTTKTTDWGPAIDFDGEDVAGVRELFIENAAYWIDEFHLDGLRFDATQSMFDESDEHVLCAITRRSREAARDRPLFLVAENDAQEAWLARPPVRGRTGPAMDAIWNDDFHHSARVALTGRRGAYFTDTLGSPQELISALRWGFLFQGQRHAWQKKRRGEPAFDLDATAFVHFLENHDQVSNSATGERLHQLSSPGRLRAMTAVLLLGPQTPMLFQGQEWASLRPFLFFADHEPELAKAVRAGRARYLRRFPALDHDGIEAALADPGARTTFERCKLDHAERERRPQWLLLHADLIGLRRSDPAFAAQRSDRIAGAVLGAEAFVVRFFCDAGDRLLVVNLGAELTLAQAPEPLLAPPRGEAKAEGWATLWSSEDTCYGGAGRIPLEGDEGWRLPGHAAVVLG
jgi:maltooligosyltrehalose trehalohydrolase